MLKRLAVSGNPVTQEKHFCTYLYKAVPSLHEVNMDDKNKHMNDMPKAGLSEVVTSSNIYMTCVSQIEEQDQFKRKHSQQIQ